MLSFVKRLAYRDRVLEQLSTLLVMYPRGRQFADDFRTLPGIIRARFEEGASPASCAVELAGMILGELLGQLDAQARSAVAERLRNADPDQLKALAAQRISERGKDPADPVALAADMAGVALYLARRMTEEGSLGAREYEFLAAAIDRALVAPSA